MIRSLPVFAVLALGLLVSDVFGAPGCSVGIELPNQVPVTPAVEHALAEMGIDYVNFYVNTFPNTGDLAVEKTLPELTALCARLKLRFSLAAHAFEPPEAAVHQCVALNKGEAAPRFDGMVFDELEHVAVLNHYGMKGMVDSDKLRTLDEAYDTTLKAYTDLVDKYRAMGAPLTATHVFPVLFHLAARAGAIPCPKIAKEEYSSITMAMGMGAAKQYGRPLWADCDLWFWDLVPGHTPEEFRSNLLLAYWLGADCIYVEGAGYNLLPSGRAGVPFSLMSVTGESNYQLTPHGDVLRRFCREYMPAHPRPWTFRDVKPQVAIVHFDDACVGQRYTGWADNLYGSPHLHSDADTEGWFALWNLLTGGHTGRDGLTFFKDWTALYGYERPVRPGVTESYLSRPVQADVHRFFVPLTGVVVYDDMVKYDRLAGVPLIVLTGKRVSDESMAAIRRRVAEGATCLAWAPLARKRGFPEVGPGVTVKPDGAGKWVFTDDFGYSGIFQQIWQWVGHPDEIRYTFGEHTVVLRRVTDNEVGVEVDGKRE